MSAEYLSIKLNPLLFVRYGHTVGLVIPFLPVPLHNILPEDLGDGMRVLDSLGGLGVRRVKCPFLEEAVSDLRLSSQKDGCVAYAKELRQQVVFGEDSVSNGNELTFECDPGGA